MFPRIGLINLNLTCRMYSTPTFHENFRCHYKSKRNSDNISKNKKYRKKENYEHMYKHLPIKAFENQYNDINKTETN